MGAEPRAMVAWTTVACVAVFALIHLFVDRLTILSGTPRSRWLSIAGGVSVAYVFVHLLPEVQAGQDVVAEVAQGVLGFAEHHVYLIALVGLAVFYGLEQLAVSSRRRERSRQRGDRTSPGAFWVHMASFALYNALIGYLLIHREKEGIGSTLTFALAMALHFVVSDFGLHEHHKQRYQVVGRWVLCLAVVAGWLFGLVVDVHPAAVAVLLAFLAGGVILNVMKEELPEQRESRYSAFLVGAAGYAALLLAA